MSSPNASLKKAKKSPMFPGAASELSSRKNVPYRTTPGYTPEESLLLDQITTNMASSRLSNVRPSAATDPVHGGLPASKPNPTIVHKPPKTVPTDNDLMGLMMTRLANLEGRLQFQAKEVHDKDKKIRILEEKVEILKKSRDYYQSGEGTSTATGGSTVQGLEKKCLMLQQQIHEMEEFLADYGMVWVGDNQDSEEAAYEDLDPIEQPAATATDMWRPAVSVSSDGDFHVDYDRIIQNIEELNSLAGEGVGQIQHTADGARIKMPETIPLTLYSNGIVMFGGPFRPFEDVETQLCVQDIMDGYFPSELQPRYPEGVPFFVTDRRTVFFKDKSSTIFKGTGQALGGDKKPSRLVPSKLDDHHSPGSQPKQEHKKQQADMDKKEEPQEVESELPGRKLTMEQFLNRLPQNVVKQGKVIDIRSSVGQAIQGNEGGSSKVTVVDTEAMQEMKERLAITESARPPTGKYTTLRIKDEKGDTFILKMRFSDTVGNIRQHLTKHRARNAPPYAIVSTFPTRYYEDFYATLQDSGLVPNATLFLKPTRKS